MTMETLRLGMIVVLSIAGAIALVLTAFTLGRQHQYDADQKRREAEALKAAAAERARLLNPTNGDHP